MTKQEKLLWGMIPAILIILFLLSSTDLIIKERKIDIYPISMIISDTSDEYYINFRKGVDKAAKEYNVDISFMTLFDDGDGNGQMELVKREIDDGASAVILEPVDPNVSARELDQMTVNTPIIVLGNLFPNDVGHSSVSFDYEKQGEMLGTAIASEQSISIPVWIFTKGLHYGNNRAIYEKLVSTLTSIGFTTILYEKEGEETFQEVIEKTVDSGNEKAVMAALDIESLDEVADIISGSPVYGNYMTGLYGIGNTTKILNQLDKGIIKGVVASDQFDAGYRMIEKAIEAVDKKLERDQIVLESYYVNRSNLRENKLEKILFPID